MNKEVIASFICCGEYMVVVELEHGTHVMSYNEWRRVYGKLHPELWKSGKRVRINRKIS